jgi:Flp pilus assembly protein TadD
MGRIEKTVFISYRRTNFYTALAVYQDLTQHGYDVFFDYQSIDSGDFEKVIIENIKAKAHFLIILSPSALERCKEPGDWLRREIETAMDECRNIVPLMMEGFDFGSPAVTQALSGKLATLNRFNGLRLYADYFFDAMEKLRNRFLNIKLEDARLHPVSNETREITEANKVTANEAAPVETTQLTAEEWFELDPSLVQAYSNLGNLHSDKNPKRYNEAETAFRKAIELDPSDANACYNLGILLKDQKRYAEAEAAFRKAIELGPSDAKARYNLGVLLEDLKRYGEAEAAFRKAIELDPSLTKAYSNLGILLRILKRYDKAEAAYRKAIELNPSDATAYNNLVILLRLNNRMEESMTLLEKMIEINPEDFNSYLALASINKQLGKNVPSEYLAKVRQFLPEDDWYNRACLESICDNFGLAFEYLEKAAQSEEFNPAWACEDPDLQWIRDDPRFIEIVGPKPK